MGVKVDIDGALIFFVNNKTYPTREKVPTEGPLNVVVDLGNMIRQITILGSPQRKHNPFHRHDVMHRSILADVADFDIGFPKKRPSV